MPNYLEILRLDSLNHSQRTIESTVHCSRHTVRSVLQAAKEKQIAWPLDDDITNAELEEILFPGKYKSGCRYVEPDYPYIHRELAKPGVTMALLWEEYCRKCHEAGETPYMSTQFGDKYRRWARVTKATMRIQHKPGDAMQVDWAGDTLPVYDLVTGKQSPAYLFMAVLPCSCYTYAEVCEDMKTENWLSCHVHAFQYFGGVTRLLIPDNCKTATTANTRYETVLNRSYQELAEYYGTAIVPARVRKPQDKSAAEASVRFAQTWIIAALRERKFFSIREMNEAIAEKLEELNNRPFQRMAGTRRSAWLEEEKPYMLPLPAVPFEAAVWSVAKVPNDYLVSDGRNKYSVPYNLIGEKVDIRVTKTAVEVFYHGSRVASHRRLQTIQREPLVKLEHMPLAHQKYLTYNAGDFSRWAMSVGPMTEKVIQHFLTSGTAPEQGYKACASLTKLGERYGRERLENACGRILAYSAAPSVRNISSLLKNGQDRPAKAAPQDKPNDSNRFGITRGASYFRKGRRGLMVLQATIDMLVGMKMTAMAAELSSQLQDSSFNELGFEDRLGLLVTAEWNRRQTNTVKRLIHNAHFAAPFAAVEEISYYEDRKLDKAQMLRFSTCKFVDEGHHIILKGASGNGKTYIACALGNAACRRFKKVRYVRMPELLDELSIARSGGELKKCLASYKKVDLLILDEWLIRPLSPQESYDLLEIVEARCQRSMIFCTQYQSEGWYTRIDPNPDSGGPVSEAIMDRIIHNAYEVLVEGRVSMRERNGLKSSHAKGGEQDA